MGMSWKDAADWDFVEYGKALRVWNERHSTDNESGGIINDAPPPVEWMVADDVRLADRGIKVH